MNRNIRLSPKILSGMAGMVSMLSLSCLSYNYSGVASAAEKLPSDGIVGMTRQQLVETYGLPERVISLDQNEEAENRMPPMGSAFSENGIFLYRDRIEHRVFLYERTRGHAYAIRVEGGKVAEVKTTLTAKGDGLSINTNIMPPGPGK
ncbi:MAG: hypothetical protein K8S54_04080 [Spirochaetia bacterium]|nr:hypothetical protein [Spirochaetia bacterium]